MMIGKKIIIIPIIFNSTPLWGIAPDRFRGGVQIKTKAMTDTYENLKYIEENDFHVNQECGGYTYIFHKTTKL